MSPEVTVEVAAELHPFVAMRRRHGSTSAQVDGSSLGHLVESLGIPLTEVGALVVDGTRVEAEYVPCGGATIPVRPVQRPQHVPGALRFLLDIHLGTLACRLRLLGIDTAYEKPDIGDAALAAQSVADQRIILSAIGDCYAAAGSSPGPISTVTVPMNNSTMCSPGSLRPWSRGPDPRCAMVCWPQPPVTPCGNACRRARRPVSMPLPNVVVVDRFIGQGRTTPGSRTWSSGCGASMACNPPVAPAISRSPSQPARLYR